MSAFRGSDQFVEFHLDCLGVSILGILNEKDHQEGDDRSESERSSASTEQLRKHCDQLNHAPQSRIARQGSPQRFRARRHGVITQTWRLYTASVDLGGRKRPQDIAPLSLSARITRAPRIRRPQTSAHSKHAGACDSCVAGSVILRSRINPSERKMPGIGRKYYRPFSRRSLSGAAFQAMTGRTVNPQVPGSSPGRGATDPRLRDSIH